MTEEFRSLHVPGRPLVLVNAWDVASARIAEQAGARAVATTSAGVAWSLGAPDGDALGRDDAIGLVGRVARAVGVPVTADIESGYGSPDETVRAVAATGAAGVNLEDGDRGVDEQVKLLAAARAAGPGLFLNARMDAYLRGTGELDEVVARAEAYVAAGADGIFVPGMVDLATVKELAARIPAPLNVMAVSGGPSVAEFAAVGVARVSLGSAVAQAAYAVVERATVEALTSGTYAAVDGALDYGRLNNLMTGYSA
ncbi:isocitrate lyase/PEP mutase family protein [Paractinoplanes bogorensis]|uniref:isocitrate lyase/PEP mutase family protein n=1 Tax=Paractinoplanes bogorensis TaxID=1610840 RepID=UPI003F690128